MSNPNDPPLDEIQWRSPQAILQMGGLHSNTVLFYFAESPFFERTSNNAVIMSQAMNNMAMYHFIQTREAFENRLRTMQGLEFMVGEEPAETGPGMGTGVWVIRKQTRRKRYQDEDEVTVHASFFVVGENIYMAPTLADILASRIMTISLAIAQALPAAGSARKWRPSLGHVYHLPDSAAARPPEPSATSKAATPMPTTAASSSDAVAKPSPTPTPSTTKSTELSLEKAAQEALLIHMRYGGEYADENPITGRPGEFHLSSTGRKAALPLSLPAPAPSGIGAMNGPPPGGPGRPTVNTKLDDKKDGKDKTPKSATVQKPRRRKSRMSTSGTPATTPGAS
ncbi:Mediator of RNA polymerase II transcription subunit 6 [Escovopsis weberi]|uniref:Mediator of RNA polymerase II transcription subunit 6 n=1 Tax=Escovopsis weberi TaxID=150374 RepID=A0A0M9VTG7_ESCWE|nr:Mediator of RNA polymerase II transcription subunit 6 [Escovopsis weberi]